MAEPDERTFKSECPNPACRCDPCRCELPCTCGLHPVTRTSHEAWDEASGTYRVTESVTYRIESIPPALNPAVRAIARGNEQTDDHGHDHDGHARDDHAHDDHDDAHDVGARHHGSSSGAVASGSTVASAADPQSIVTSMGTPTAAELRSRESHDAHATHASESIRTAQHKGHEVLIKTSYELSIDGSPLMAHVGVNADGSVHYHGLPNYTTGSAVDLAKQIIDSHPYDYPPGHDVGSDAEGEA